MYSPRPTELVYRCPTSTPAPPASARTGRNSAQIGSHQRQSDDAKKVRSRQNRTKPEIKYPHYMQRRNKATWMNMEYYYNTGTSSEVKVILPGNRNSVWLRSRVSQPVDEIMAKYKQESERENIRVFQRDMYNTPGELSLLRGWENNSSTPRIVHRNYNIVLPGVELSLPDRAYSASVAFPRREPRHLRNGVSVAERLLHLPSAAATRPQTVPLRSASQYDSRVRQSKTSSPDTESRATSVARVASSPLYTSKLLSGRSNMTNVAQILAQASVSPDYYDQFRRQSIRSSRVQVTPWARNVLVYRQPTGDVMHENMTNTELVQDELPESIHDRFTELRNDDVPESIRDDLPEFVQDKLPEIVQDELPQFSQDNRPEFDRNNRPEFDEGNHLEHMQSEIPELSQDDFPEVISNEHFDIVQDTPHEFLQDETLESDQNKHTEFTQDEFPESSQDDILDFAEDAEIPETFAPTDSLRPTSVMENIIVEKLLQGAQGDALSEGTESDDMSIHGLDNP